MKLFVVWLYWGDGGINEPDSIGSEIQTVMAML